jgi:Putative regulator of cell autolysis
MINRDLLIFALFFVPGFCLTFLLCYTATTTKELWFMSICVAVVVGIALIGVAEGGGLSQAFVALFVGVFSLPGILLGVAAGLVRRHMRKKGRWQPWAVVGAVILSALLCALLSAGNPLQYSEQETIYIYGELGTYAVLALSSALVGSLLSAVVSAVLWWRTPPAEE